MSIAPARAGLRPHEAGLDEEAPGSAREGGRALRLREEK